MWWPRKKKQDEKSGFLTKDLPQPGSALKPCPEFSCLYSHFSGHITKATLGARQEPKLQHELSTEDENKLSPDRGGLRLSLLYDTKRLSDIQHPLNILPPELQRRVDLTMKMQSTMPSMTNYSNMEAPTPMKPKDRPV